MQINFIDENYQKMVKYLNKLFDSTAVEKYLSMLGDEDKIKNASYAINKNTGLAYDGSLINTIFEICDYACKINDILPESKQVERSDIYRVGILSQLIKAVLFMSNPNQWEIDKLGKVYTFTNQSLALRSGERAIYYAMHSGLDFNIEVYEAIRIFDKDNSDDNYTKYFSGTLAVSMRQATEIVELLHSEAR